VAEVAVIGVPHAIMGQSVKAFIAVKPGEPAFDHRELRRFLGGKLASYEMPSEIEIVAGLPKTIVGKPSRQLLREAHSASAPPSLPPAPNRA
jgi:long-chain acyl-CoA synthetase